VGFFEPPPAPPEPPEPSHVRPEWLGPPDNLFGVSVPLEPLALVRTGDALTFACEWPSEGVTLVDASAIREASMGATTLWEETGGAGGGSAGQVQIARYARREVST
jgi:hypothetical protein